MVMKERKRGRGRPRKNPDAAIEYQDSPVSSINFKCLPEQHRLYKAYSKAIGVPVSEIIRGLLDKAAFDYFEKVTGRRVK